LPFVIRQKILAGAVVLMAAALLCVAYLGVIAFGSSRWESAEPKHLALLPELRRLAPLINIDSAVVYGFQDKIYRFRFKPNAGLSLPDVAQHLRRDNAYTVPKDEVATLAHALRVLDAVPGTPGWWTGLKRQDPRRASLFISSATASRAVVLILLDDYGYGQLTEH
jgi:hypothetical protein